MALCCQNREYIALANVMGFIVVPVALSVHSTSVTVLGLLRKKKMTKKEKKNLYKMAFCLFQVSNLEYSNRMASIEANTFLYAA